MISFILNVTTFFQQASDFVTAKWPEVLAILTSATVLPILIKFGLDLIISKVKNKTNAQLQKEIASLRQELKSTKEDVKQVFDASVEKMGKEFAEQQNKVLKQYKDSKKKAFKKIIEEEALKIATEPKVEIAVEEKPVETPTEELVVVEQETTVVAEEVKVEEILEETENVAHNENESLTSANSDIKVAKRVIVEE